MSDPDLYQAHRFDKWHEGIGDVLWWRVPVQEPPYVGSPLDLGRTASVSLQVGLELIEDVKVGMVGGWPFTEEDEERLVWTRLPGAIRMPQ